MRIFFVLILICSNSLLAQKVKNEFFALHNIIRGDSTYNTFDKQVELVKNYKSILNMLAVNLNNKGEGLIIRWGDCPYKHGRSKYLLKLKHFEDDEFVIDRFSDEHYQKIKVLFEALKKFYINRYNKADAEKEKVVNSMTNTAEKEKEFEQFKNSYQNESIAELVKNNSEMHRIIEKDGKLIQKIFPIYKDPDTEHRVDFDAQFYMPSKHFLNRINQFQLS